MVRSADLEPADMLRSGIPLALLLVAAAVPVASPVVLAILLGGLAVASGRDAPVRWSWAAPIPVAGVLTWRLVTGGAAAADPLGGQCTVLASPPAVWAVAEAAAVLAVVAGLVTLLRTTPGTLGGRLPARRFAWLGVAGTVVLGALGVGAAVAAGPLLGGAPVELAGPGFLGPALVFAVAGGVAEEVAYRGVLLHWAARTVGVWPALVAQALVYGVAHGHGGGPGSPVLLVTVLGAAGFVAGLIAVRTRSLALPIAWHVALDLGLYAYLACRA